MDESGELSIQGTAVEALVSKASAMNLNYFEDDFLKIFCKRKERKPPLINRGYFARVQCIRYAVQKFLSLTNGCKNRQILVLGGGYDTTSLNILKDLNSNEKVESEANVNCYEIDFKNVIDRKAFLLTNSDVCRETLLGKKDLSSEHGTAASLTASCKTSYGYQIGSHLSLIAADMNNDTIVDVLDSKIPSFDFKSPTLILTECVLVYMDRESVEDICSCLASKFNTICNNMNQNNNNNNNDPALEDANKGCYGAIWVSYDMYNPNDRFGQVMLRNLRSRGISVPGFTQFPTLNDQITRLTNNQWESASSISMLQAFNDLISGKEKSRIHSVEIFDEIEEWQMIMEHYCLTLAATGINSSNSNSNPLSQMQLNSTLNINYNSDSSDNNNAFSFAPRLNAK